MRRKKAEQRERDDRGEERLPQAGRKRFTLGRQIIESLINTPPPHHPLGGHPRGVEVYGSRFDSAGRW